VAEGVETVGQMAALRAMGCAYLQGWLIGHPVPVEQLGLVVAGFDPALLDGEASEMDAGVHSMGRAG
jgi:predicted signal transduction protein with EAL and GGDEF domain